MKSKMIIVLLLLSQTILAAETKDTLSAEFYLPGLQHRSYQDDAKATQFRRLDQMSLQFAYNKLFLAGLEFNRFSESSGGVSLNFKSESTEWLLYAGYNFINSKIADAVFNLYGTGYFGQNQTEIETTLLGQTSTQDSEAENVIGFGLAPQVIIYHFIFALDARWLESRAYSPQATFVTTVKLGYSFSL